MNAIGKTWHFSAELIVSGEINYLDESQFFPGKLGLRNTWKICPFCGLILVPLSNTVLQLKRRFKSSTSRWSPRWRRTRWSTMWSSGSGYRRIWSPWWPKPRCITGAWRGTPSQSRYLTGIPPLLDVRYFWLLPWKRILISAPLDHQLQNWCSPELASSHRNICPAK